MRKKTLSSSDLIPLMLPLQKIIGPLLQGKNALWAQLRLQWEQIVGPEWASHTLPLRLIFPTQQKPRGLLHVAVWGESRLSLSYESPYICEKINQYFGFGAIHEIKWRTTPPPVPQTPLDHRKHVHAARPLGEQEQAWISAHTQRLPDLLQRACHDFGESLLKASEQERA